MCKVNITFQVFQAAVQVLHRMAFWLSGKVVALHLDNITAKAYLCNQYGTASLLLARLACHIFNLANKCGITLIPACIPTNLNVETDYHVEG